MASKNELKNAFVKVAGNDNWLKSIASEKDIVLGEEIVITEKSPLVHLDTSRRYIKASNDFDLVSTPHVIETRGVIEDFAEFLAENIFENQDVASEIMKKVSRNLFCDKEMLQKHVDIMKSSYDYDANPEKGQLEDIKAYKNFISKIDTWENSCLAAYKVSDILLHKNMEDDSKKEMLKDELVKANSGDFLISVARGLKLSIGEKGFDVVTSVMKHSEEIGVDAFRVKNVLRIKKDFVLNK